MQWKSLNQIIKREKYFNQEQIEPKEKRGGKPRTTDTWLNENEEAIKRHMKDL